MKTNLQQAWQHQKHVEASHYLYWSHSHRLLSPLTVKASNKPAALLQFELLHIFSRITCFISPPHCILFFTQLQLLLKQEKELVLRCLMTEVSLRKLAVQVSKRTHVLCVSNQCSQESRKQILGPETP